MKLKDRIKKWLFSDELQKIEDKIISLEHTNREIINYFEKADKMYKLSHEAKVSFNDSKKEVEECRKLLTQICDVGVDVGFMDNEHSWAVVCVAGRPEYVKFLPLNNRDARGVLDFLKQFQYSKHVIDSPLAFRGMLKDMIL